MHGSGHIHTFDIRYPSAKVAGLAFLPELNSIGVAYLRKDCIRTYSLRGSVQGSVTVPGLETVALTAMGSTPNSVVVADGLHRCLHVLTLGLNSNKRSIEDQLQMTEHKIWKLPFMPSDVRSFKENILLVSDAEKPLVFFFTEDGQHRGSIKIQTNIKIASVSGGRRGIWLSGKSPDEKIALVALINARGNVLKVYDGETTHQPKVRNPNAVLEDTEGRVILADSENNQIHLLNKDGVFHQFLLQADHCLYGPTCLHMDYSGALPTLFVVCDTQENSQIKIFDYNALISGKSSSPIHLFEEDDRERDGTADNVFTSPRVDTSRMAQCRQRSTSSTNDDYNPQGELLTREEDTPPPHSTSEPAKEDEACIHEMDVQSGTGLLRTIMMQNSVEIVHGVIFLSGLQCICVIHEDGDRLWFYSLEGETLGSSKVDRLVYPLGIASLPSKPNTIAVADFDSKCLHVVSLTLTDDHEPRIEAVGHAVWKLRFQPTDVSRFKANLLVVDGRGGVVHVLTEDGRQLGSISMQIKNYETLLSTTGTSSGLIITDYSEQGAVYRVDSCGHVLMTYNGKTTGQKTPKFPSGLAALPDGSIIFSDTGNHRLQLIDNQGNFLRFLLEGEESICFPQRLHLDTSSEKGRLLVPCGNIGDRQLKVYDCGALLESSGNLKIFSDEEDDEI